MAYSLFLLWKILKMTNVIDFLKEAHCYNQLKCLSVFLVIFHLHFIFL